MLGFTVVLKCKKKIDPTLQTSLENVCKYGVAFLKAVIARCLQRCKEGEAGVMLSAHLIQHQALSQMCTHNSIERYLHRYAD